MHKPAENHHEIHDLLRSRWSPRAFSNRPVEENKLLSLFEAARWSPSGGNTQPWAFVVVTPQDEEVYPELVKTLSANNALWAVHAPVLVLSVAIPPRAGTPIGKFTYYDVGQAVAHLSIQAGAMGLHVHQMGGFNADAARQVLQLPAEAEPMALIAIGYYGKLDQLPEELRNRELGLRTRKPLAEFVYGGRWNQPLELARQKAH